MSNAPPNSPRVLFIIVTLAAMPMIAIVCLVGAVGWGVMTGRVADTMVLPGNELKPRMVETVSASAGLAPNERILYFYSSAITPEGDGNLLTDQRVISYFDDGTDAWCNSIAVDDIVSVDMIESESWLEDSIIWVASSDGFELTLWASNEGGGDVRFVDAIRSAANLDGE